MGNKLVETVIDGATGEVLHQDVKCTLRTLEPDYVKLYIKAWCDFKAVKGVNVSFLYTVLPYMTYANKGQYLSIPAFLKEEIGKELGWKETTIKNRFRDECAKLCKANVFKKVRYNVYQVNPELIGKGDWKDVQKLRATFNLSTGEVTHHYEESRPNHGR